MCTSGCSDNSGLICGWAFEWGRWAEQSEVNMKEKVTENHHELQERKHSPPTVSLRIRYVCSGNNSLILDVLFRAWKLCWLGNYLDKMTEWVSQLSSCRDCFFPGSGMMKTSITQLFHSLCKIKYVIPVKLNNLTKPRISAWVFST